jgi:hypothetical protein
MILTWIIGGIIAGALAATLIDELIDWGRNVLRGIRNVLKGVVRLVKRLGRVYQRIIVHLKNGQTEEWRPIEDTGRVVGSGDVEAYIWKELNTCGVVDVETIYV